MANPVILEEITQGKSDQVLGKQTPGKSCHVVMSAHVWGVPGGSSVDSHSGQVFPEEGPPGSYSHWRTGSNILCGPEYHIQSDRRIQVHQKERSHQSTLAVSGNCNPQQIKMQLRAERERNQFIVKSNECEQPSFRTPGPYSIPLGYLVLLIPSIYLFIYLFSSLVPS